MKFGQETLKTKLILGNSISVLKSHELVQRICTVSQKSNISLEDNLTPAHRSVKRKNQLHAVAIIGLLKECG